MLNRWCVVVAGMYLMFMAGSLYLFPDYSDELRQKLEFTTEQVDFIGTMANLGTWLGVIGGLVYDSVGPKLTGLCAGALLLVGYFLLYLGSRGAITCSSPAMGVYALIMGQGGSWAYTGLLPSASCFENVARIASSNFSATVALNISMKNFPSSCRGSITGLLVCCFGLCAGIFAQLHKGFFTGDVSELLLFLAICTPSVTWFGTLFTARSTSDPKTLALDKTRIRLGFGLIICIAVYVATAALAENFSHLNAQHFAIGLCIALASLPLLVMGAGPMYQPTTKAHLYPETTALLPLEKGAKPQPVDITLWVAVRKLDFWILFFIFFAGIGSGITVQNNLPALVTAQLPPSLEGQAIDRERLPHSGDVSAMVTIFAVSNTFGRLAAGYSSDVLLDRIPRPAWLMLSCVSMGVVQVIFMFADVSTMYCGVVLLGFSYGSFFCILPTLTSELFGTANFGAIFGLLGLAPAMGSELLGTTMAGKWSDSMRHHGFINVTSDNATMFTLQCLGHQCFLWSLVATSACCCAGFIAALWLTMRCCSCPAAANQPVQTINAGS